MVSPLDKNGGDIRGIDGDSAGGVVQAAPDGNAITYVSLASFGGARGASLGSQYSSTRRAGTAWETENMSLPMSAQTFGAGGQGTPYDAFSEDLSLGLVFGGLRGIGGRPVESPPLAGAPAGYENYYLNQIPHGPLQPVLSKAPGIPPEAFSLGFLGATQDLGHIVVKSPAALAEGAVEEAGKPNLYEWDRATGLFQPLNVLPTGAPILANLLALGDSYGATDRAISTDGSSVVWTEGSALYVRRGIGSGQPTTLQLDAPAGGGRFLTASVDGSRIFFADTNRLTSDSTAAGGGAGNLGGDLYEFEPARPEGERLRDLTVDHNPTDSRGAEVQGVLGASEDGDYLYFVANGVLAPEASPGNCAHPSAPAGASCNLYLWHEGETRFVARVASGDDNGSELSALGVAFDWEPHLALRTTRVSRDGTRLAFMSERSLTGYDNTVSGGVSCGTDASEAPLPAQCEEVFLYEADTRRLSCVSCNPSGAPPVGASGIPGGTDFYNNKAVRQSRVLSEGGPGERVFFDSADALVPQDTNGQEDVYEYEGGQVHLLSGGRGAGGASFVDASTNGDDAFFVTREPLVAQDSDQLVDLYDARAPHAQGEAVGSPAPVPPVACEGESCRSAIPSSPALATFSSSTFTGAGNAVPVEPAPPVKPKPKQKPKPKKHKKAKRGRKARAGRTGAAPPGGRRR
ncbi:MAG TPA: hypothetical protein VIC06_02855 [Solirubrobacteraceae bacterium]|jgi:hypothetical protein